MSSNEVTAPDALRRARLLRIGAAFIADTATVTADVRLGADTNIWYGVAIRGDDAPITIGDRTNIQDNAVVHVDPGAANTLGHDITVGHSAICHGVEIGDYVLIGMGAVLLSGTKVGEGSIIGAGSLLLENTEIPPYSLVVGSPARIVRQIDPAERKPAAIEHAGHYVERAREHADGTWDGQVRA